MQRIHLLNPVKRKGCVIGNVTGIYLLQNLARSSVELSAMFRIRNTDVGIFISK